MLPIGMKSRTTEACETLLAFTLETGREQALLTHQRGKSSLFLVMIPESL